MESSIPFIWGTSLEEQKMTFPGDKYVSSYDHTLFRGVDVDSPASIMFRWLCQLKAASYSYDWIENFEGVFFEREFSFRSSPQELIPGIDKLSIGQIVMNIFRILEFEVNRSLTLEIQLQSAISFLGKIIVSYVILPTAALKCRLIAKICITYPRQIILYWMRWFLPWADLIMCRKQFLTLKQLAESALAK
ncbi:MAG: hypothetical protein AAGF93_02950 [Cyanobacteria bacterium P01_H01_bin.105]